MASSVARTVQIDPARLVDGFRDWARVALASIEPLTPAQRQLLWDLQRPEKRYGFGVLAGICTIARRSNDPAVYLGPAEVIRTELLVGRPLPSLDECEDQETIAQAATDLAQRRVHREHLSPSARLTLRAEAIRESEWARRLADCASTSSSSLSP